MQNRQTEGFIPFTRDNRLQKYSAFCLTATLLTPRLDALSREGEAYEGGPSNMILQSLRFRVLGRKHLWQHSLLL